MSSSNDAFFELGNDSGNEPGNRSGGGGGAGTAVGWSGQTRDEQQRARVLVTPRQAWQFSLIPLAQRGGMLEFATSADQRSRAERFVSQVLCLEPHAQLLDEGTLSACLHALYPPPPSAGYGVGSTRRCR